MKELARKVLMGLQFDAAQDKKLVFETSENVEIVRGGSSSFLRLWRGAHAQFGSGTDV
jgi:hypothetical protein